VSFARREIGRRRVEFSDDPRHPRDIDSNSNNDRCLEQEEGEEGSLSLRGGRVTARRGGWSSAEIW